MKKLLLVVFAFLFVFSTAFGGQAKSKTSAHKTHKTHKAVTLKKSAKKKKTVKPFNAVSWAKKNGKVKQLKTVWGNYKYYFLFAGKKYGVDPKLLAAISTVESSGVSGSVNKYSGASGLMQLAPPTAKMVGVKNIYNPLDNVCGGAKYMDHLLDRFHNNLSYSLYAYNNGPTRTVKDVRKGVKPGQNRYVKKVKYLMSLL